MGKDRAYTGSTFGGPSYVSNFYSGQLYAEKVAAAEKYAAELMKRYDASSLNEALFIQHYESMTLEQLRCAWNSRIVDGKYRDGLSHDEVKVLRKIYLRMNGGKL